MPPLTACDSDASVRDGGQRQGYSSVTAATSAADQREQHGGARVELRVKALELDGRVVV